MPEYKISKVSSKPPREWSFQDKRTGKTVPMETYKVMLEGTEEPVDVNRKPGSKPEVGEVLSGHIESSEFGQRFKAERKPFTPGQKDGPEIKAMWSIGQAVEWLSRTDGTVSDIEPLATDFFGMVERVKSGQPQMVAKPALDKVYDVPDRELTTKDLNIPNEW